METIFDHNPTQSELAVLFGRVENAEVWRTVTSQDDHFACLARLMAARGREDLERQYVDRISDPQLRFDTAYALRSCLEVS